MMKIRIVSKKNTTDFGVFDLSKAVWVGQDSSDNGQHYTLTIIVPGFAGTHRYDDIENTFEEIEISAYDAVNRVARTIPEIVERWTGAG
jgi:hypothetical protein